MAVVTAGFVMTTVLGVGPALAGVPPLSVYGRLPNVEQVEISPDGAKLAIAVTDGEKRMLLIREATEDSKLIAAMNFGDTKLRGVQWAGPEHVLITTSSTAQPYGLTGPKREYLMAFDYNLVTKKQRALLENQDDAMNVVLDDPAVRILDGVPYAFVEGVHFVDNYGQNTLYKINLKNGATRMLDGGGDEDTDGWLVSADGQPLAQSRYDEKQGAWSLKVRGEKGWTTIERVTSKLGSLGLAGMGRDGRSVLVWREDEDDEDKTVLNEYALDGSLVVIPDSAKFDALIHAHDGSSLVGAFTLVGDDRRYTFFDAKLHASWNAVIKAFPGDQVTLSSWSDDKRQLVVLVDLPTMGQAYALVDLNAKSARFLTDVYRDLNEEGVSKVQAIKYKAADGLEITGYLTLPRGKDPKNLPLVVLPHGGPKSRDTLEFDWWRPGPGLARLRGAAAQFPRLVRLRLALRRGGLRRMGPQGHADRPVGRRAPPGQAGRDRSQAGLHRRRQLRRLRGPGRGHPGSRGLPLRRLDRRPGRPQALRGRQEPDLRDQQQPPPSASGCSTWARTA